MIGTVKTKLLMGLVVMAMLICALPLFSAPVYAAGTITDENGNNYANIKAAVDSLNDGGSIVLTVTGDVRAYYSTAVCNITKNVNVTILSGSYDAKITGGIYYSGGGKLTFGRAGETNVMSMDGQISIESGELVLNPGLNMNPTGMGDACVWASSWNESAPVNVKIDGCTFITGETSTHNHAVHLLGPYSTTEYIRNSEIVNTNLRRDHSLLVDNGASLNELSNTVIKGDRHALSVTGGSVTSKISEISKIDNCDITASVAAVSVAGGKIGTISDSTITNIDSASASVSDATRYSAIRMISYSEQETGIDSISNCTITCNGTNQTCAGIQMIGQSGHEKIHINTIEDCKIISSLGGAGIYLTGDSRIGSLDAEEVTSEKSSAVTITQNSTIEEIKGGIYTGQTNAVNNLGSLTMITGDPVFYGKTGYAVANANEEKKISVEPTLSTEMQGNARYYGAQGEFEDPDLDTYPTYTPKNIKYSMSTLTEAVDGISGVGFHYLTVNVEVKYDGNGGTGDMSDKTYTGEYRSDLTAEENVFTWDGYTFNCWNTKADGYGIIYNPEDTIDITEAETTLYAQWDEKKYNVTVSDDGNGTGSARPASGTSGTEVTITASPENGYMFNKWEVVSGGVTLEKPTSQTTKFTIGTSDVEVKATFKVGPIGGDYYPVTWDPNGGTLNDATYPFEKTSEKVLQPVYKGGEIEILAEPTMSGFTFLYWECDGKQYMSGEKYTVNEKDKVFTAQWKKNSTPAPVKYTITYDLNGGEYDGSTDDITEEYEVGTKIKIHEAPTREGYTFLYWKGSEYQPGDEYTVTKDHTLVAQWKKNAVADDPENEDNDGKKKSVKTGDETNLISLLALLFASAGTLAALGYRRRRS